MGAFQLQENIIKEYVMGISIAIIIVLLAFFVIGATMLVIQYQKEKIRQSAEKKGWRIQNISYRLTVGWRNASGIQEFVVRFMDEKGRSQSCTCRMRGPFSDVDWSA